MSVRIADTQFPQPPVFYQDANPGVTKFGSMWVTLAGVAKVYTQVGWINISTGTAVAVLISPYNPNTYVQFTVEGGIRIVVNGEERANYEL